MDISCHEASMESREHIMKREVFALATLALGLLVVPAMADTPLLSTLEQAKQVCGSDDVVWVNLDRQKFYKEASPQFGKSNGVYTCAKGARAHGWREAKED
jgi:hypothetical protein